MDYFFEARNLLRAQMASKGITLVELARLLNEDGGHEDPRPLSGKINRGKFPLAFFLQCMKVMGMDGTFVLLPKEVNQKPPRAKKANAAKKRASNVREETQFPPNTEPASPRTGRPKKATREAVY
ncbi:DUF6471 domain-containing protein [Paraburkholderia nemoris]|uniref:DUF6471 domain-containing protein n=1 Tax=Paraburkholderia nemoris TaxID=2793076 RepID=UPI0038B7104F